jgi:hypothetical protein
MINVWKTKIMNFNIGDSIVVKKGVQDPDFNAGIEGWQGRISDISDEDIVCINWDSITLKKFPISMIDKCEQEGWGWDKMYLGISEIELSRPRDTDKDVKAIVGKLKNETEWLYLGESGQRIQSVLSGVVSHDLLSAHNVWNEYFNCKLSFPFEASVEEPQERGPVRTGGKVIVRRINEINEIDELRGILVDIEYKKRMYVFPLADLEVVKKQSKNFTPIKDYVIWFANC